jgi:tRNA modification GTPase
MATGHPALSDDTIAAIATATGGGVGILRLSGPHAISLIRRTFRARRATWPPGQMVFGHFVASDGEVLDEGFAVIFEAPRSFTGEDVAELHLHGGAVHLRRCLAELIAAGARPAAPGEYLQRAFLNGRIDLTRAEAIADLVAARTERAARLARRHLHGQLEARIQSIRNAILDVRAAIEVNIDFIDEDVPLMNPDLLAKRLDTVATDIDSLLATHRIGRLVRDGATVVLAGAPNAGKSSLFNHLYGSSRAIVTPIPGTTRDLITESIDIQGIPVTLADTAGLRETDDPVEILGIARTREAVADADLVLYLLAPRGPEGWDATEVGAAIGGRSDVLLVCTKSDAVPDDMPAPGLRVSVVDGEGIESLVAAIGAHLGGVDDEGLVIARERHRAALATTRAAVARAAEGLRAGLTPELPAVDLHEAMDAVGEIVGDATVEDMLDRLFRTFCIGK